MNQIELPEKKASRPLQDSSFCGLSGSSLFGDFMGTKRCSACKKYKLLSEFCKNKSRADGLNHCCKDCVKVRDHNYYLNNKQKIIKRGREYKLSHYEEMLLYYRKYNLEHREEKNIKSRKRSKNNREQIKIREKLYAIAHPNRIRARNKVGGAIRLGKLIRSNYCELCGVECKPEGHHWSYLEEHWLAVIWLCASCHRRLDHSNIEEIQ